MQAHETELGFLTATMSIEIPYFQRPYVWGETNWEDLFDNLIDNQQSHFLGSIILKVIKTASGEVPRWSVVDGQQRLTTLTILVRACYDVFSKGKSEDDDVMKDMTSDLKDMLFFKRKKTSSQREIKIKHSVLDRDDYRKVIEGEYFTKLDSITLDSEATKDNKPTESGILKCYKYFCKRLLNDPAKSGIIWDLLFDDQQKILVKIDLESDDREQAIFDTINSAGVRLTCADTIKNALFQRAMELSDDKDTVESLYRDEWEKTFIKDNACVDYWSYIQQVGRMSRDNLEILLHCVALIKEFYDPVVHTISDLSDLYKEYISKLSQTDLTGFIKEIAEYGNLYRRFFKTEDNMTYYSYDNDIQRLFHILNVCDVSTLHSYVLKLLKMYVTDDSKSLPKELLDELKAVETFVIRHTICRVSTKSFNKICALLISGKTTIQDELNTKSHELNDSAVFKALCSVPSNKIAALLLFWIELKRRNDDSKMDHHELKYSFSLEHIMPQSWSEYWGLDATPAIDYDTGKIIADSDLAYEARQNAIYELGNMTLLNHRLNASLRNYGIKQKIEGLGKTKGMKTYSELLVAKEVISTCQAKNEWNEQMIRRRTEALFSEFISIWGAEFYGQDLSEEIVLYLVSGKCNASAIYLGEKKLMVLKGSVLSLTETPSCGASISSQRKELFSSGKVVDGVFTEDVVFNTPSQAAACITGNARNGWKTWKDQNGTTLADLTSGKALG